MSTQLLYKRVLLKISGEMLSETDTFSAKGMIVSQACQRLAQAIKTIRDLGIEVGIVVGGGNIFRGIQGFGLGLQRTPADQMGMLATLINGIALQQALESVDCTARVMSALDCPKVAESYQWQKAREYLASNTVVIFVGGTGNPYFTTDTAAALRASEIQAEIVLKATKVDGIYNKDPLKYSDAIKYDRITYSQILADNLKVMDATSIALCMQSGIPIFVFNMRLLDRRTIVELLSHQQQGTLVHHDGSEP